MEEYGDQIYAALGGHQRALEAAKQSKQPKLIRHAQENVELFEYVIAKWREGKMISPEREAQLEDRRMYGYQALDTTIKRGMDPLENLEHSIYEDEYPPKNYWLMK